LNQTKAIKSNVRELGGISGVTRTVPGCAVWVFQLRHGDALHWQFDLVAFQLDDQVGLAPLAVLARCPNVPSSEQCVVSWRESAPM